MPSTGEKVQGRSKDARWWEGGMVMGGVRLNEKSIPNCRSYMKLFKPRFPPTKWNCRSEQNTNLSAVHKAERRKHTWNLELTTRRWPEANSNTVVNIYAQPWSTHPLKLTVLPKENGIYLKTTWENVSTLPPWGKAGLWAQKRIVSRASASTMLHKTRVQEQPVSKVKRWSSSPDCF